MLDHIVKDCKKCKEIFVDKGLISFVEEILNSI